MMNIVLNRREPAYEGAKFDVSGCCILHSDVRLRKPKNDDGKYAIVRKMCFKCCRQMHSRGSRRTTVSSRDVPSAAAPSHGRRRRTTTCRAAPSDFEQCRMPRHGGGDRGGAGRRGAPSGSRPCAKKTERRHPVTAAHRGSQRLAARAKRSPVPDREGSGRGMRRHGVSLRKSPPPTSQKRRSPVVEAANTKATDEAKPAPLASHSKTSAKVASSEKMGPCKCIDASKSNTCAQALVHEGRSPRIRRHSISLFSTSSLSTSQNRPPATSEMAKKRLTNEKIKELIRLMPSSPATRYKDRPSKDSVPFNEEGYCRAHPKVRLAKKKPGGGSGWEIVSGVCPLCCVSAVLACHRRQSLVENERPDSTGQSRPSDAEGLIGKVLTMSSDVSDTTWLTTGSSSNPVTPVSTSRPAFSVMHSASTDRDILGLTLDLKGSERTALNGQPPGPLASEL